MHASDGRSNHIGFSLDLRRTVELGKLNHTCAKIPILLKLRYQDLQYGHCSPVILFQSLITFKGSTLKTRISSFHHWTHPPIPCPEVHHLWQMNWRKHFSTTPRRLQRTMVGNIFSTCSNFVLLKRISFREVANLKHYRKHWNANGKYVDEKNM